MRVLCVGNRYPPWSPGGYEVIWAEAVRALRAAGHDVRVLTTLPDPSDRDAGAATACDHGVHRELRWYWRDHAFPTLKLRDCLTLERGNAAILRRHLEVFSPEAVMWWAMGGMSLSLLEQARRARMPALGVVGDDWINYGPRVDAWTRRWRRWPHAARAVVERLTYVPCRVDLDRAARWVFISEHLLAVARSGGPRLADAVVVHPGVDPRRFAPRPVAPWRWRLLYCGRVDPRKGIATAIEALTLLPSEATLTIDGDGARAYIRELADLALARGVGDRVRFACSASAEVPKAYAAADAVVFPVTWAEPWGLVPLEAMSTGRPVVATRAGGGPGEYLRNGHNCLQFEPGDASALAEALLALSVDPELRSRLVDAGQETAAELTAQRFNERLVHELERVTSVNRY